MTPTSDLQCGRIPMDGDLVICIGENSLGVGRELERAMPPAQSRASLYQPQYLYVHDQSLQMPFTKKQDSFQFIEKAYRWQEAYENSKLMTDCILSKIENCDSPRTLTLIYDATTALGSGVSKYLTNFITNALPGLTISTVGILPHLFRGGFSALHTVMAVESALSHQCNCLLRCLNDSEYILDSNGLYSQCIGLEPLYSATASDLMSLLSDSDPLLPTSVGIATAPFRSVNLLDIRTSRWPSSLQRFSQKKSKSKTSAEGAAPALNSSAEKMLRHLSINLHSLHLSSTLLSPSAKTVSSDRSLFSVSRAELSISSTASNRNPEAAAQTATGLSRLNTVLQGATPGVIWPESIPHRSPSEGFRNSKESEQERAIAALCFTSPYADHLLEVCYQDACASHRVGAYQRY
jgi:hypothetical protein